MPRTFVPADEGRLGRRGDGHLGAGDVHRGGLHGRLDLRLQVVDRLARPLEEEVGHLAGDLVAEAPPRMPMPPPATPASESRRRGLLTIGLLVAGLPDHGQRVVDVGVLAGVGDLDDGRRPELGDLGQLVEPLRAAPHHHGHHVALGRGREVLVLELLLGLERGLGVVPAGRVAEQEDDLALEVRGP